MCVCVSRWTLWYLCVATVWPRGCVFRERERREKERDEWERQYGRQSHSPSPTKHGEADWSPSFLPTQLSYSICVLLAAVSFIGLKTLRHALVFIVALFPLSLRPGTQLIQKVCKIQGSSQFQWSWIKYVFCFFSHVFAQTFQSANHKASRFII